LIELLAFENSSLVDHLVSEDFGKVLAFSIPHQTAVLETWLESGLNRTDDRGVEHLGLVIFNEEAAASAKLCCSKDHVFVAVVTNAESKDAVYGSIFSGCLFD